ncbi:MAG: hypothetical protein WBN82_03445 [Porticoccaceae bacterium]
MRIRATRVRGIGPRPAGSGPQGGRGAAFALLPFPLHQRNKFNQQCRQPLRIGAQFRESVNGFAGAPEQFLVGIILHVQEIGCRNNDLLEQPPRRVQRFGQEGRIGAHEGHHRDVRRRQKLAQRRWHPGFVGHLVEQRIHPPHALQALGIQVRKAAPPPRQRALEACPDAPASAARDRRQSTQTIQQRAAFRVPGGPVGVGTRAFARGCVGRPKRVRGTGRHRGRIGAPGNKRRGQGIPARRHAQLFKQLIRLGNHPRQDP